jgi:[ribosomal protein S18]-alanine N-acetyltransferase
MENGDLPEVLAIEQSSFPNPWRETTFRGEIQNDDISFPLVAVHATEKKIVGYIIYWKIKDEIMINNIAVHPDFRRLGVGESILRDAIERGRGEKVTFVSLEVRISNKPAQTLYAKLGFDLIGVRKNYYFNPDEDALVFGLNLMS